MCVCAKTLPIQRESSRVSSQCSREMLKSATYWRERWLREFSNKFSSRCTSLASDRYRGESAQKGVEGLREKGEKKGEKIEWVRYRS